MPAPSTPDDGDLVIRQELRDRGVAFVLHMAHGADQLIVHTRDAALAHARTFAKQKGVRVWVADGDHAFTLIENFREPTWVRPGT